MRKGNFDAINETIYQFGQMGDTGGANATQNGYGNQKNLHISAWATRNWIGYTHYRVGLEAAVGLQLRLCLGRWPGELYNRWSDSRACKTANTFENMFPTNHIHMGYMDVQAWKNMMSPSVNFQFRPTKDDHIEIWAPA